MSQATEQTLLLENSKKSHYTNLIRKIRLREFQFCIWTILVLIFITAITIIIIYNVNQSDNNNSTKIPESNNGTNRLKSSAWPIEDVQLENYTIDNQNDWDEAMVVGEQALLMKENDETNIPSLPIQSASYRHQRVVATTPTARKLGRIGLKEEYAARHFHRLQNSSEIKNICTNSPSMEYCLTKNVTCNLTHKYRTFNGSCNNVIHPTSFGVAYIPFRRALPANYADGISEPRKSQNGQLLPSARTVSLIVHPPYYKDDKKFTVMLAVWGQFLDHDITATALSQKSDGSTISCCNNNNVTSPECFPVYIDSGDPFTAYNVTCMEFVRSAAAPTCCLGPREQLNQVTSFIDGSVIYGVEPKLVNSLRTHTNGELKFYKTEDNRSLLPVSDDLTDGCNREEEKQHGRYCFLTGDARANENLHLTSMHLLWVRQHNLLASTLRKLNPKWNDEKLFEESRKILGAQMQHITYNEFLPIIFGEELMETFELSPQKNGYFSGYNSTINPSIANHFATAAFRFAHTIIPGLMKLLANDTSSPEFIQMHKMLFNPFKLYQPGEMDRAIRGAMHTNIEATDAYFTNELKQHLFERDDEPKLPGKLCGLDLVSLNIQRGRDHGLPGYTKWRNHCGLSTPSNFDDLSGDVDKYSLHNMKAIYKTVDDIDLYTGALSEIPLKNSIVGPTITCLLLDQFRRIKYGDRFWYETPEEPQRFTPNQLSEIRKTTLARIICDNSDDIHEIQPHVMRGNQHIIPCAEIPLPKFDPWKQN